MLSAYAFMFSVNRYSNKSLWVDLFNNKDKVLTHYSGETLEHNQVSGSAVLVLLQGDTVLLDLLL